MEKKKITAEEVHNTWREKHFPRTPLGDHAMIVTLELAKQAFALGVAQEQARRNLDAAEKAQAGLFAAVG